MTGLSRRARWRVATMLSAAAALVAVPARPALAHDQIEEALARGAGPTDWVYVVVAVSALAGLGVVVLTRMAQTTGLTSGPALRHWSPMASLLLAWVLLGVVQAMASRSLWSAPGWLWGAGYLLLPGALAAVWIVVVTNFRSGLTVVFTGARYRWLAGLVATTYLGLALWAGNMVAVPEEHDMPPAGTEAFLAVGWTHGPVAAWPTVEFWVPGLRIFGALSAGMVPVIATVAALMGLAWAAGAYALGQRSRRGRTTPAGTGRLASLGVVGTAGLNVCCCCAPAMYPVLALLVGPAAGASVSAWFLGSSSPLYDLGLVAMIALTIAALGSLLHPSGAATSDDVSLVGMFTATKLPVG